jgi:hypothetical protein
VRARHVRRPPDLTSLFDVLFIVVFAALIRAAAVENAAAHPVPAPTPRAPETPPAVAALRQRALANIDADLAARTPLVVRISRDGTIESVEADGAQHRLVAPLVERSPNPELRLAYSGDVSPQQRVCRIAAQTVGAADLSRYLVIMVPAVALNDLPESLHDGLYRDLKRCRDEQNGEAALVDPTTLPAPTAPAAPAPPGAKPTTPPGGPR